MIAAARITWEYTTTPTWKHDELSKLGEKGWEVYHTKDETHYMRRPIKWHQKITYKGLAWVKEAW
jgi:hypothetical protein